MFVRACPQCGGDIVYKTQSYLDGASHRATLCRPCLKLNKPLRDKTPAERYARREKWIRIQKVYGLTKEQFETLLEVQKGCAICGTTKPGGKGDFHVDHDHVTDRVRGLLCQKCNMGLGSFCEDVVLLERAVRYLKNEHD